MNLVLQGVVRTFLRNRDSIHGEKLATALALSVLRDRDEDHDRIRDELDRVEDLHLDGFETAWQLLNLAASLGHGGYTLTFYILRCICRRHRHEENRRQV